MAFTADSPKASRLLGLHCSPHSRTPPRIFLVGHSLGGAPAVVAAWRLTGNSGELADWLPPGERIDAGRIAGVLTYGMPRAGDEAFEAPTDRVACGRRRRLEYGSDIVPSLPPAVTGQLAFRHVGPALHCPHGGQFKDSLPPRDDPDDRIELAQLEELLGISNRETLRSIRDAWRRILDHGVPRSPVGGAATLIIDRLPFFLRDHLQDCYLEALGWSFARPPESRMSINADDADAFAHASEVGIEASGGGLSALLRRLLPGG
jgi:triacylglycerol lipase